MGQCTDQARATIEEALVWADVRDSEHDVRALLEMACPFTPADGSYARQVWLREREAAIKARFKPRVKGPRPVVAFRLAPRIEGEAPLWLSVSCGWCLESLRSANGRGCMACLAYYTKLDSAVADPEFRALREAANKEPACRAMLLDWLAEHDIEVLP